MNSYRLFIPSYNRPVIIQKCGVRNQTANKVEYGVKSSQWIVRDRGRRRQLKTNYTFSSVAKHVSIHTVKRYHRTQNRSAKELDDPWSVWNVDLEETDSRGCFWLLNPNKTQHLSSATSTQRRNPSPTNTAHASSGFAESPFQRLE